MQTEEKRPQSVAVGWPADVSRKRNTRTTSIQNLINKFYDRYNGDLTSSSDPFASLSYIIGTKIKKIRNQCMIRTNLFIQVFPVFFILVLRKKHILFL